MTCSGGSRREPRLRSTPTAWFPGSSDPGRRSCSTWPSSGRGTPYFDVACGTGAVATAAAARVGASGSVTGVDNNPGMLAVASARFGQEVRWPQADAQALPFRDHSFDRVICPLGLQLAPRPARWRRDLGSG
ncbi:class I SAM-dependent methyltransferase [Couchioplanes caeruleus]|uniref:class I SAM-dependent methyltransferase n=1 Tax=Couchioplanes caeruleus TaxID=56438 RepID=UPI000A02AAB7|nr:class I SAM-dependent methyltransferase [Couchioplanes caeruleus]